MLNGKHIDMNGNISWYKNDKLHRVDSHQMMK